MEVFLLDSCTGKDFLARILPGLALPVGCWWRQFGTADDRRKGLQGGVRQVWLAGACGPCGR